MRWTRTAPNTGLIYQQVLWKDIRPQQKSGAKSNHRHIFRKDHDLCFIPRPQKAQQGLCQDLGSWTLTGFSNTFPESIIKQVLSLGAIY